MSEVETPERDLSDILEDEDIAALRHVAQTDLPAAEYAERILKGVE